MCPQKCKGSVRFRVFQDQFSLGSGRFQGFPSDGSKHGKARIKHALCRRPFRPSRPRYLGSCFLWAAWAYGSDLLAGGILHTYGRLTDSSYRGVTRLGGKAGTFGVANLSRQFKRIPFVLMHLQATMRSLLDASDLPLYHQATIRRRGV